MSKIRASLLAVLRRLGTYSESTLRRWSSPSAMPIARLREIVAEARRAARAAKRAAKKSAKKATKKKVTPAKKPAKKATKKKVAPAKKPAKKPAKATKKKVAPAKKPAKKPAKAPTKKTARERELERELAALRAKLDAEAKAREAAEARERRDRELLRRQKRKAKAARLAREEAERAAAEAKVVLPPTPIAPTPTPIVPTPTRPAPAPTPRPPTPGKPPRAPFVEPPPRRVPRPIEQQIQSFLDMADEPSPAPTGSDNIVSGTPGWNRTWVETENGLPDGPERPVTAPRINVLLENDDALQDVVEHAKTHASPLIQGARRRARPFFVRCQFHFRSLGPGSAAIGSGGVTVKSGPAGTLQRSWDHTRATSNLADFGGEVERVLRKQIMTRMNNSIVVEVEGLEIWIQEIKP